MSCVLRGAVRVAGNAMGRLVHRCDFNRDSFAGTARIRKHVKRKYLADVSQGWSQACPGYHAGLRNGPYRTDASEKTNAKSLYDHSKLVALAATAARGIATDSSASAISQSVCTGMNAGHETQLT